MDIVQRRTLNGVTISLHWQDRSLRIGCEKRQIPENYTEDVANQFVNNVVPSLRSHEVPAALKVYQKSNVNNFWVLLIEQLPRSPS